MTWGEWSEGGLGRLRLSAAPDGRAVSPALSEAQADFGAGSRLPFQPFLLLPPPALPNLMAVIPSLLDCDLMPTQPP